MSATFWTIGGHGVAMALRLAGNVILARLLFPEAFGLMALVMVLMQGLHLFSDFGIQPSIIQNPKGDSANFLNTAWTIQAIRGVGLWAIATLAAVPFSIAYGEPSLAWMIPVAAVAAMVTGLNSTALITENKKMRLGRITVVELLSQAAGLIAMITMAYFYRNVWALVVGGLIVSFVKLILSHLWVARERNYWHFDRGVFWEMFSFGKWIFVSTLLTFLVGQSDKLIFGQLVSMEMLGIYAIAAIFAMVPADVVSRLGGAVIFPAYCRTLAQGGDLPSKFKTVRVPLVAVGLSVVSIMVVCAPALVELLYDDRYAQASWILQVLLVATLFQILECTNGCVLLAYGNARIVAAGSGAKLVAMGILIPVGYTLFGFPGAVFGYALSESARYAVSAVGTNRYIRGAYKPDLAMMLQWVGITGTGYILAQWLQKNGFGLFVGTSFALLFVLVLWIIIFWRPGVRWIQSVRELKHGSQAKP